ncbi:phosphotransferase [Acetatifactor aquisgranensis]|uniref:phosphotransferase n=1 Tax=Acetatifactor aquisgranensis TaxID=2941233 RepID=UPI00204197D4|nr:phosphotransferase [Acetatifactor aquisgranensis]
MQETIREAVLQCYGVPPGNVRSLGGGFYGRVFLVSLETEPFSVVLKLYLFPGLAAREAEQTRLLSEHSLLKMPRIYKVLEKEQTGLPMDALFMEYIEGVNAGDFDAAELPETAREAIGESIVDNLIGYHRVVNPEGFGILSSGRYCPSWQEYYYPIARGIVEKAGRLREKGQISDQVMETFRRSIEQFRNIFHLPITRARLIHGDYNTWNVMLDRDRSRAVAVIDPFHCCWADSEFDLYQLDNANGKGYGLLERYSRKMPLSGNFQAKRRFYELYTEVSHYHDARVEVNLEAVEALAERLNDVLQAQYR